MNIFSTLTQSRREQLFLVVNKKGRNQELLCCHLTSHQLPSQFELIQTQCHILISRVWYDISPRFTAIKASTRLGRESTRITNMFMWIFFYHSFRSSFVSLDTNVGTESLACSLSYKSSWTCSCWLRSDLCEGHTVKKKKTS